MKRVQRKINFKKLQEAQLNSGETNNTERRQTRSSKATKAAAGLSAIENNELNQNEPMTTKEIIEVSPFAKSVNLTRFLYKDKSNIPAEILKRETDSSDDFETPVKKIKTAPKSCQLAQQPAATAKPKTKNTRKRCKQPNIKSALLRTEQMFSEIAAQHCMVDNFNPDDIQMALVMSRSEVDTCNVGVAEGSGDVDDVAEKCTKSAEEDIHSKLRKYGFRTAAKGDYANFFAAAFSTAHRRGKTKWANKFTALTLRDAKAQAKKLNERIEALLAQQYSSPQPLRGVSEAPNYESYKVQSNFLQKHLKRLPDAQFFRNAELFTTTTHLERFFIEDLFTVAHLSAGHLLKDWTIIPGRDVSPQRRKRKRLSAHEKKFESFYKELLRENLLTETVAENAAAVDYVEPNENVSMLVMSGSQNNCDSENELNGLLDAIAQTTNAECAIANAMEVVAEEKNNQTSPSPIEITSSTDSNNFESGSIVTNTQTRCTSPDLFADSDSDCGELIEENNLNDITTLENFSSEEVKTCLNAGYRSQESLSMKAYDVVDLTEDVQIDKTVEFESCASVKSSNLCEKESANDFVEPAECYFPKVSNTQTEALIMKTLGIENNTSQIETTDHNENISNDLAGAVDSTQSDDELCKGDDDDDGDDRNSDSDCILLSDDEINYSILKANEANENKSKLLTKHGSVASTISSGSLSQVNEIAHNFSVLELVEDDSCFAVNKYGSFCKKQTFDLSSDAEPIKAHYLSMVTEDKDECVLKAPNAATPTKRLFERNASFELSQTQRNYAATDAEIFSTPACFTTPTKNTDVSALLKAQRAEFGILESQSETFSQTPPHWQHSPEKSSAPLSKDESPLCTVADVVPSAKRLSYKFNSFLQTSHDLGVQPLGDLDDFDEFDRLVYGSPPPKPSTVLTSRTEGVPTGLSQLLTGEISFNAPLSSNASPSPKHPMETPEKTEEITINERVYLVRKTCAPKPNFEAQSEADILKQLYEFGIKPLKRKQAIKLLEYIYNETHPVMGPAESGSNTKAHVTALQAQSTSAPAFISNSEEVITESEKFAKTLKSSQSTQSSAVANKFNFQDCCGAVLLRFSMELFAEMRNDEEVYIFQTNVTKKTQQPLVPLHIAWFNLVCSSQELHESILMYEPIELQEVYLFLKNLGYRYDPKDLKSFFDRRCIIFRYDLTAPEKQKDRHTRKPRTKAKKFT